jgi:hypothetical protein
MSEMIERVARRLAAKHYSERFSLPADHPQVAANVDGNWHVFADDARAAIEAMREPPFPIIRAMLNTKDDDGGDLHARKWEAAIDAALE